MKTVTKAFEVPQPGSVESNALEALLGTAMVGTGMLVGFAAGKAAALLPEGARIVRVVVVAEVDE